MRGKGGGAAFPQKGEEALIQSARADFKVFLTQPGGNLGGKMCVGIFPRVCFKIGRMAD